MQKKPLNILLISFDWRNIFENNNEELIRKLERDRLAPDINNIFLFSWSTRTYYKEKDNIITYHRKARFRHCRIFYDFLAIFLVPYAIYRKKFKPDIILVYEFPFILSGILTKLFWKSKIVLLLGALPSELVQSRKQAGLRKSYQRLTEVLGKNFVNSYLVISPAIKKYLINLGVKVEKIRQFSSDVILRDKIFIDKSAKGRIRKKYNIPENKSILLSVGRLEPEKGCDLLLEAFYKLKRDNLVLIIAGTGIYKEKLEKKIKEYRIKDKVIFAGQVSREEIWDYYRDADVFILLSRSEGLGLVFWEAMYMNVPVIGSRIGGIVDTIGENEERGYFYRPDEDVNKLSKIIDGCVNKEDEVENKKKKAQKYIKEIIKSNHIFNDYIKVSV